MKHSKQSGFTLVEIAIVLVIIGLLLGGVLKGQEIIKNAKVKNLENSANGVATAIYTYQDRYRALPGDDKKATRFGSSVGVGDGNSAIAGAFYSTAATATESQLFWLHLRNAGIVAGDTADTAQPLNAFQGLTGAATGSDATGTTISGIFAGFTQIPSDVAEILESRTDDGEPQKGTIQSDQANYTTTAAHKIYFAL